MPSDTVREDYNEIFDWGVHRQNYYRISVHSYRFVGQLLRLLVCPNEKFGAQIQKHVKELVGHEMAPALYPILFDQIKVIVEKFFDQQGQVKCFIFAESAEFVPLRFYLKLMFVYFLFLGYSYRA